MMSTPFQDPIVIDYFETTLASAVTAAADVTATLASITNNESTPAQIPSEGYGVISSESTSGLKEGVWYDTLNVGAKTVRLHGRGLGSGTTAQSHAGGETFAIAISANYLNDVVKYLQSPTVGHTHNGTDAKKVDLSAPNPIGGTTPAAGTFTNLTGAAVSATTLAVSTTSAFSGTVNILGAANLTVANGTISGPTVNATTLGVGTGVIATLSGTTSSFTNFTGEIGGVTPYNGTFLKVLAGSSSGVDPSGNGYTYQANETRTGATSSWYGYIDHSVVPLGFAGAAGMAHQSFISRPSFLAVDLGEHIAFTAEDPYGNNATIMDFAKIGSAYVQTTVGAAGAASALPGAPRGYIKINQAGIQCVVPYWLAA